MTTHVTIRAGGPCYPVRIIKTNGEVVLEDRLLPGGDSTEFYLPNGIQLSVEEEFHAEGYPFK